MADTQFEPDYGKADNENTHTELPMDEIHISVRGLVEFILRHGDIDNRRQGAPDNAMQEGGRIHRMIQRRMGAEYRAEVPLRYTHTAEKYVLVVEGRADGIIEQGGEVTIDEIKGTYRDLARMKEPAPVHVAQAKCYAYIYGLRNGLGHIRVRMTYCNIETEDIRYFYEDYDLKELGEWFQSLIGAYRKWADYSCEWRRRRQASIEQLEFPFPYREGQRELVTYVYHTIYQGRKLFLEAPTGVGKTVSTVFPAVKAMGKGMGEKIFYLTAKTITRTVAEDTFALLRERGLCFKSVILTARDKICFLDKPDCNPESCPYARGHYDRINDAIYAMLVEEQSFTRSKVEEYALRYRVCPFEMCLDMSLFADGVICDYNYLFDPHVYLRRFFGDGVEGEYLFLIDEAHNLLERGREMYSASLFREEFLSIRRELKQTAASESSGSSGSQVAGQLELALQPTVQTPTQLALRPTGQMTLQVTDLSDEETEASGGKSGHGRSILVRRGYAKRLEDQVEKCNRELLAMKRERGGCRVVDNIDGFVKKLERLYATLDEYLDEQEEGRLPVRETLLDFFFEISHFLDIYERMDEHYVKYTRLGEDGSFLLKLFCVNPGKNLKECMHRGRSSILFSATFLPIQYYKGLLGGDAEDYEVYASSVFRPEKKALFIANDVTSRYTRRSEEEYYRIARYIDEVVRRRHGNYMVFCPSYSFLRAVYDRFLERYAGEDRECILQSESMDEEERERFLAHFRGNEDCDLQVKIGMEIEIETQEERTLIGFCVLGGIFSEGIDLKNDSLIGAIIVGTGIPQVCDERELLRRYFDGEGESGFDYSYRYPGMNKVLQAAGRVIRTAEDVGVIALLDERFLQPAYRRLFPREWEEFETVSVDTIGKRVERFWDSWL